MYKRLIISYILIRGKFDKGTVDQQPAGFGPKAWNLERSSIRDRLPLVLIWIHPIRDPSIRYDRLYLDNTLRREFGGRIA